MACCAGGSKKDLADAEEQKRQLEEALAKEKRDKDEKERLLAEETRKREEAERLSKLDADAKEQDRLKLLEEERRRAEELRRQAEADAAAKNKPDMNAEKKRKLIQQKQAIYDEAKRLLEEELEKPAHLRMAPEDVAGLQQTYIAEISSLQLPYFAFAALETIACITFGRLSRCGHFATVWLTVDASVMSFGAIMFMLFVTLCLAPLDRALETQPYRWGRRLQETYDADSQQSEQPEQRQTRQFQAKSMHLMTVMQEMAGYGKNNALTWYIQWGATGGIAILIAFVWGPFWTVIGLLREIPEMLMLFLNSCDPILDITVIALSVVRVLYLLYMSYTLYRLLSSQDTIKTYLREMTYLSYYDYRLNARLGMDPEDGRYKFWPDSMRPGGANDTRKECNWKDLEQINHDISILDAMDVDKNKSPAQYTKAR